MEAINKRIRFVGFLFLVSGIIITLLYNYPAGWVLSPLVKELYPNLSIELISISLTVLLIDYLYEQKERESLKAKLIRELGSEDKGFSSRALKELKVLGWLTDGSLAGKDLAKANLSGLDLSGINLRGTNLENADLSGCALKNANLDNAKLNYCKLSGANLENSSLNKVELKGSTLYKAVLIRSRFIGCDLMNANLELAELIDARIEHCKLEEANLRLANLTRAKILHSNLLRVDVHSINADGSQFERCDFNDIQNWTEIINSDKAEFLALVNIPTGFAMPLNKKK